MNASRAPGHAAFETDHDTTQTSRAFGRCTPGTVAHVKFEVSQFMGDTVSDDVTFNCPYVP
ncbi:hypothetical protein [Corallococcus macrosporus]|uniref:Uncharacterized protein n=1 Tax=Myxococcus fulvus (strain ATCC BAA-855 / HW-1) TaxID=483219 RepID=F8CP51_MYXFH|nr:hypothetical protein [Corallococcus macrosporus]AEI66629.1 hypothetical protein LILAB_23670 [Corallococcus macrosporus]